MHAATLKHQFNFTHFVIRANTEDISQEESLCAPEPGGNCLNWVVGHILASRDHILSSIGRPTHWNEDDSRPYQRGSSGVTQENAAELSAMLALLDESQETLLGALDEMTQENFDAPAPEALRTRPDETNGSLLAGIAFHEAYHAGQIGLLRRLAGKKGALS